MNNKSLANVRHRPQVWTQVKYFIQSQCWQNNLKNEKEESERNKNHGKDSLTRMSGFRSGQNISLDGWSASSSPLKRPAPLWSELYCRPRGPGRQVRCSFRLPSHPRTSRLQSLQTTPQWCGPCRLLDITSENQHCQLQWLQGLGGPQGPSGGTSDLSLSIVS